MNPEPPSDTAMLAAQEYKDKGAHTMGTYVDDGKNTQSTQRPP